MFCPMGPQHHCHSPTQWTCPLSSSGWPCPWGTRWWHPGLWNQKETALSPVPGAYIGSGTQVDHGDLWITFRVIFYLFLEGNCVWSWVALLSCPVDPRKPIAFPHSIFLIPFIPSQQCFYWYNPISVPGFSRDGWLNLWVISSWNAHVCCFLQDALSHFLQCGQAENFPCLQVLVPFCLIIPSIDRSPLTFYYEQ